jgi:hypothetical protein
MNRIVTRQAVVRLVATLGIALIPALALAQGGSSPLVPPQSKAFGKSFDEWNTLAVQFAVADWFAATTNPSDTVGRVRFLPGDFSGDPDVEFDVTMSPGTPFAAAPWFVFGERYDDPSVPDDDPVALAPFLLEITATTRVRITLDGRVLLNGSSSSKLAPFVFGPTYFDEPIVFDDPQPRGPGLNSVAGLWAYGIGAVFRPLPPGEHTLVFKVETTFPNDFVFTYHITVTPK